MFKVKSASKFTLLEKRWAASCGYYMLLGRFGTNSIRNFGTWLISLSLSLRAKASVNRIDDDYTNMWSPLYHWNSLNLITYNQREHAYIILLPNYPSRLRRSTWRRWSNFHVSNIQNDREPGLISNRSHHSKVFFLIYSSSLPPCFVDVTMKPSAFPRTSPTLFSKDITVNHSGTGFNLCFPMHHSTIPMSRWSFDWCFQALLVSTQVRWARPIHQRFMDPLGHAETGWKGWREWTAKWNWMNLFRYGWESFLSWVRPSNLGKVGDWCGVLFPK